jgi:hypothetical protein
MILSHVAAIWATTAADKYAQLAHLVMHMQLAMQSAMEETYSTMYNAVVMQAIMEVDSFVHHANHVT